MDASISGVPISQCIDAGTVKLMIKQQMKARVRAW
jgi:hypothetical protein